jgi:phosphoglycolate phosphatase-like HAD superfamily hydrolase
MWPARIATLTWMSRAAVLWEPGLAPTGALFEEAVTHVVRKLGRAKPFPSTPLPDDRAAAVAALDAWAGGDVDWRGELRRYYEEHIPVRVRPAAAVNSTLRRLHASGARLVWATPGPVEATDVLLHHLGIARLVDEVVVAPSAAAAAAPGVLVAGDVETLLELASDQAVAT